MNPPLLHVTSHAIARYRERVAPVPEAEAARALRTPAVAAAARFGAPWVRLPGGQRVVLRGAVVVTVLEKAPIPNLFHQHEGREA